MNSPSKFSFECSPANPPWLSLIHPQTLRCSGAKTAINSTLRALCSQRKEAQREDLHLSPSSPEWFHFVLFLPGGKFHPAGRRGKESLPCYLTPMNYLGGNHWAGSFMKRSLIRRPEKLPGNLKPETQKAFFPCSLPPPPPPTQKIPFTRLGYPLLLLPRRSPAGLGLMKD